MSSGLDAYNKEMAQIKATFNEYLEILSRVDRPGIENLIEFLKSSDFSTAPASTHYHSNFKGGLCKHSLNVYNNLKKLNDLYDAHLDEESMIVVALLHDLAKIDYYEYTVKNYKNYCENGRQRDENGAFNWASAGSYRVKESALREHVYSEHGVCSFLIANKYIKLEEEEIIAIINHHMDLDKSGYVRTDISEIYDRYVLASLLHVADTLATYIDENKYRVE